MIQSIFLFRKIVFLTLLVRLNGKGNKIVDISKVFVVTQVRNSMKYTLRATHNTVFTVHSINYQLTFPIINSIYHEYFQNTRYKKYLNNFDYLITFFY